MKNSNGVLFSFIFTAIIGFVLNYIFLPALTLASGGFWLLIIVLIGVFVFLLTLFEEDSHFLGISATVFLCALAFFIIALALGSVLLNSKRYADMLEGHITEEHISTYNAAVDNVPLMDKNSAMLIANRRLGSLEDVISQFEISETAQITLKGRPIRVSILEYAGFFKWKNNKDEGTPGYILVDMKTQEAELVRVKGGIKYSPSEVFSRDLNRYLRKNFSTLLFEEPTLELDEEGHPFWVVPTVEHTIGLFGGKDITGVITVNSVTGDIEQYKVGEIPDWIDNVYPSDLLIEQYDNYGKYQKGFWNTLFGQKGVKVTTDGYNYIPQDNDNWIYTGVTSVVSDESNIGFVLINKRTKETIYYNQSGAEEYSAMSSAEGVVQHLGYTSTFPLLLQIEGKPTYMVALKDEGGLVKMYGMVNVEKYQIVATGDTISSCQKKYRELLLTNGEEVFKAATNAVEGKIEVIKEAIKEGTSYFYIKLEESESYYSLNILDNEEVILLEVGDFIKLEIEKDTTKKLIPSIIVD